MPLWPYFLNVRRVPSSLALRWTNWYLASPNSLGRGCPFELVQQRLGVEGLQVARARRP